MLKMDWVNASTAGKPITFQLLETKMAELDHVHGKFNTALLEVDVTEDESYRELENDDT